MTEISVDCLFEYLPLRSPGKSLLRLAVLPQNKRRQMLHAIEMGHYRIFVGVQLTDFQPPPIFDRDRVKSRGKDSAPANPIGIKVDQNQPARLRQFLREAHVGDGNDVAGRPCNALTAD